MADTEMQTLPTCPYCGYVDDDHYGIKPGESVHTCARCGKDYAVRLDVAHYFTTRTIEEREQN